MAHFDLSVAGRAGRDHARRRCSRARTPTLLEASGGEPASETAIGGHVGIAARVFLAEWTAVRLEVKDYVYFVEVPNNGSGGDMQNQLFTELGVSVFFPTRNRALR